MLEHQIESRLVEGIRRIGGVAYKWTSPNRRGVPDRIVFLPGGSVFFVEVKSESGKLSPPQVREHARINSLGHLVRVVNSAQSVDELIETFERFTHNG